MPYDVPDDLTAAIVSAPPTPASVLSPDGTRMLLVHHEQHPPLSVLARPWRGLAGLRVDPATGLRRRTVRLTGLSVVELATGRTTAVEVAGSLGFPAWAPDSSRFAFTVDRADGLELVLADGSGTSTVPDLRLTDVLTGGQLGGGGPFTWSRDSRSLLVLAVPADRQAVEDEPELEPVVEETAGQRSQMATYADLLSSPADERAFEVWATSQAVRVDAETLESTALGEPGLLAETTESPDGSHLLVEVLQRPFSARVPYACFARRTEVWTASGERVAVVADLPVSDEVPSQGVPTGPRATRWHEGAPARLVWLEALDGGDPRAPAERRDALLELTAPWQEPREWLRLTHRCNALMSLDDDRSLVRELDRDRRWSTTWLVSPESTRVVFDRAQDDAYGDPGSPVAKRHPDGHRTLLEVDGRLLLSGDGASPDGNHPFLAWHDLGTGASTRVFTSAAGTLDRLLGVVDPTHVVLRHESPTLTPNDVLVDLTTGERRPLTDFPEPHPQLAAATKRLVVTDRGDGVPLSGMLHLPPGHDPAVDGLLPLVVWAYPDDFGDARTAGQVRSNPGAFTRLAASGPVWFTLRGFAVLVDATMPVIGDPETMNDTFVEQISAAAAAHVAALEGIVDPSRVIAAGHSYGGFMTANLLAHTDLFVAGIARSGAYNRTLTPFGFQNERRSYWEAKDVYDRLSPFRHVDQITAPLLLVHGAADNNPGTYPIQSERLFRALQATGGTARLVLLPHESHGYQALESVLHVLAEQFAWAERWAGPQA